ncbi:MAG: hypothetical protein EAZ07_07820 [Cytophagales bacterium]|nr:MAG: hypothetical protein EAZ07_07820 [Cytophagales bacterium]
MKDFKDFNAFQTLAVFGIIFSIIVQVILLLINKHVDNIWALYPTWITVFIFGTVIKRYIKYDDDHTHHHEHDNI